MPAEQALEFLMSCTSKRVVVVSSYIADKPRSWEGYLKADRYDSYWLSEGETEVHFSAGDVKSIAFMQTPVHIYLLN